MPRLAAAAALAACVACSPATTAPRRTEKPNILLVTIDTWRADRLNPDVTPNLSALAASGVLFTNVRSAVPLTLPSHTTIMTGLLPPASGVRENGQVLSDAHATLARLLKEQGYTTAAFVGAFVLDRRFGLAQGFDVYDDRIPRDADATEKLDAERPASVVVDAALDWLSTRHPTPGTEHPAPGTSTQHPAPSTSTQHPALSTQHPFFLWIHFYDPHAPYIDHGQHASSDRERYDGEVRYVDTQVARVLARVRTAPFAGRTAVIVAGDHGEGLGDHGERTHGMLLYDSTLRVPLVVAGAGVGAAERRSDAASLVDLAPTILHMAGVQAAAMTGRNLFDAAGAGPSEREMAADIYAETEYPHVAGWSALQALSDGRWKTIHAGGETELYDVDKDPGEANNIAGAQASTAVAMTARIETIRTRMAQPAAAVSSEAQERLRALGYVASSAPAAPAGTAPNPSEHIGAWNRFEDALATLGSGRSAAARASLSALAARYPDAAVFQTTFARAVKESGDIAAALALYRAAAQRWPTDASLLHDLAVTARDAGRLDEAVKADAAAVALDPSSAVARNGLGLAAIDLGHAQDAIREFTRATALDPNNASYWVNLGNAQHAAADSAAANQSYRKALDLDPRSSDAANGIGVLLVEAKRPAEAVPWFERALKQSPLFIEAQLNLGIALQQGGEPRRASEHYRAILDNPMAAPRERAAARDLLAALGPGR